MCIFIVYLIIKLRNSVIRFASWGGDLP